MTPTTLFLDVGSALLTNGWDHLARRPAAKSFNLQWSEIEERHSLNFETREERNLSFEDYPDRMAFYRKRPFTESQFKRSIFEQSQPIPGMIEIFAQLKTRHGLKIAVVSNESREANAYRIRKFKLDELVDSFVSSCFVHMRKPDTDIFRLALDITQAPTGQVLYVENAPLFVELAEAFGIRRIFHTDYQSTCAKLASFGFQTKGIRETN